VNTTQIGSSAESAVCSYLVKKGHKILFRNWKRRTCEIDIVSYLDGTIYFVEVKYRSSDRYGAGTEYITPAKLNRMKYAAELWSAQYGWTGPWSILGAGVSGKAHNLDYIGEIW
jgi:putative endonuclease